MAKTQNNNSDSDLWISVEEAIEKSGVSRRTIQSWVKAGQVKKEKKQGIVYLWVSDLVKLTPLVHREKEVSASTEIIPPSEEVFSTMSNSLGPIRNLGEQVQESMEVQQKILEKVDELRHDFEMAPRGNGQLDAKTVKELSLLGQVFKSIYQQNEKVSETLQNQEKLLLSIKRDENLKEELDEVKQKKLLQMTSGLFFVMVIIMVALWGLREFHLVNQSLEGDLDISKNKNIRVQKKVDDLNEKIVQKQNEYRESMNKLDREYLNKVSNMKKEHEAKEEDFRSKQESLKNEFKKDKEVAAKRHQLELETLQSTQKEWMLEHKSLYEKEIERLEAMNQKLIGSIQRQNLELQKKVHQILNRQKLESVELESAE